MDDEAPLFKMLDEFAKFVEAVTGMKRQFIDAGWNEDIAEQLVLQALKASQ